MDENRPGLEMPQNASRVSYEPQYLDGKVFYKGKEVGATASRAVKDHVSQFLLTLENYLMSKYGIKAVLAGSLAKDAAVRGGELEDIDARLIHEDGSPVNDSELAELTRDEQLYERCLKFLDSADDPMSGFGKAIKEHGIHLRSRHIDFIGEAIEGQGVKGFQTDTWSYRRRFGKNWETDTTDYEDPMVIMRRKIREEIEAKQKNS